MEVFKLDKMKNGWFIGDFEPSVFKNKDFELGYLFRKKGNDSKHFHKLADEFNLLVRGKLVINGTTINEGEIFVIKKNEIVDPFFLEDSYIVCLKMPSVPGDKYLIND